MSQLDQARFSHIDYARVPLRQSVYGEPQPMTLRFAAELWHPGDKVLFLAEGDGRYAVPLTARGVMGVALDTDMVALRRLAMRAGVDGGNAAVEIMAASALTTFPHAPNSFDGVISTGFLYLHPEDTICSVVCEAHRVLKPGRFLVVELLSERTRTNQQTGELIVGEGEVNYSSDQMRDVLGRASAVFDRYAIHEHPLDVTYMVPRVGVADVTCHLTGKLQVLVATK